MAYEGYAEKKDYEELISKNHGMNDETLERLLKQASRHIDSLTYNRIVSQGFSDLTEFQKDVIREVCCRQAEFEHENEEELNTILSGYSINGTSVQFGSSWNIILEKGVAMKRDLYALLCQTGLCCRLAR